MSAIMKQWGSKHLYIPWISLWLILLGLHAAVCSVLAGHFYIQEVWLIYGISALLILILALLPRRFMISGLFVTGLGIVYWCWKSAEQLLSDLYILVYHINQKSHEYIRQSLIAEKWSQEGKLTVNYLLVLLCILLGLFIAFSLFRYFNRFYGVLPIFLLYCGGLMLGKAPESDPTAWLLVGMALAFMWVSEQQGNSHFSGQEKTSIADLAKRYVLTIVIISIGLSGAGYCMEHFQEKVFENVGEIQKKQHEMELTFQKKSGDLLQHVRGVLGIDGGGKLSNSSPYYTDSVVMTVTVAQKPSQNVYLRGFVGDIYHKGSWKASDQIEDWNEKGSFWGKHSWKGQYLEQYDLYGNITEGDMEIRYKRKMRYRYQPYRKAGNEELTEGEWKNCRGEKDDKLSLYEGLAWQMKEEGMGVERTEYDDLAWQEVDTQDEDIKMWAVDSYSDEIYNAVFGVQWILRRNAEYNLLLDPLPYDRDYAEYFLFVSGKGYCEHFATAGTLLLRHLGAGARYATGYCITADQFSENEDGTYTAEVLDSDAHAWSEVRVAGVWLPQEMTPGNGQENAGRETETVASGETDIGSIQTTDETAEGTTEEDDFRDDSEDIAEEEELESETGEAEPTASPEETAEDLVGNHSKGGRGGTKGDIVNKYRTLPPALKILLAVPVLCIPAAAIIWLVIYRKKRNREIRLTKMRLGNPKRYVGMRMALLLERMKRAGLPIHMEMSERECLQILQEHYKEHFSREEQDSLLELIRRAAFSREQVTEDEIYWLDRLCRRLETAAGDSAS